jgi:1-acyl-sn-glycerol-3-phosphate acyltransferase
MIGYTYSEDVPVTGCRKALMRVSYKITSLLVLIFGGIVPFVEDVEFDYSPYLGPNYKATTSTRPVSTIVSNHACWCDIIILLWTRYGPSFAAKKSL